MVPDVGADAGAVIPRFDGLSLAVDSTGSVGLGFYKQLPGNNQPGLLFWRPSMASPVPVTDSQGVQNDGVSLTLAFEGTKPRVAGLLTANLDAGAQYNVTYVSSPDNGATWSAPEPLSLSGGAAFYSAFATDQKGNEAITSFYNGSTTPLAQNAGCGPEPFVARSTNSGGAWSGCKLNTPSFFMNGTQTSLYGASRIASKLTIAGSVAQGGGAALPDGGTSASSALLVYYQDP
jgi:hypothetical protein